MPSGRILSIQSHVTYGYVGGKAAVFPLQCLGYDVDVVNSVNFSNHSGYGHFGGTRTTAEELKTLFRLMQDNDVLTPTRLLTGYVPGAEALLVIEELSRKLRTDYPDLIYLLDPVMGDAGKLYVAPAVVPIYRSMLPLATIITPNWFEVEVLTDVHMTDIKALQRSLAILHREYHVPNVVITSIPLLPFLRTALPVALHPPETPEGAEHGTFILCLSSSAVYSNADACQLSVVHAHCVPALPGYFSGVGDLFSALVLAHFDPLTRTNGHTNGHAKEHLRSPSSPSPSQTPSFDSAQSAKPLPRSSTPLAHAVSLALTKTHAILSITHAHAIALPVHDCPPTDDEADAADPARRVRRMRARELRLVPAQDVIRGERQVVPRKMGPWDTFWAGWEE